MSKINSFFLAIAALFLFSCSSPTPPSASLPNFSHLPKINMDVAGIEVIEAYESTMRSPNIEHIMPYTPADTIQLWVKDRLNAAGKDKLMQVNIIDASVKEENLPRTKGVKGLFTVDQEKRYDVRIEVELRIYGGSALSEANTSVIVTGSSTIPENASVNYREGAYKKLVNNAMTMLNQKLESNIREYMNNHIVFLNNYQ